MGIDRLLTVGSAGLTSGNARSRAALGVALAGLLLASTACSSVVHSPLAIGTPLPLHQVLRMNGLEVTVDDVSPAQVNTDGSQRYVATYTLSNPAGYTEPLIFNKSHQVLFADGKQYPADKQATVAGSDSSLEEVLKDGETKQSKVVFDVPAGAKVTEAGVYVDDMLFRVNLAS